VAERGGLLNLPGSYPLNNLHVGASALNWGESAHIQKLNQLSQP
jgi:hypothetical protein